MKNKGNSGLTKILTMDLAIIFSLYLRNPGH